MRHRDGAPRGILEERMVDGGVVGAVLPPHPEREHVGDLVGDVAHDARALLSLAEDGLVEVGADGGVAAGDVEADANDRHLVAIGGDTADGHHIARMAIGHQRRTLGARRHVLQLTDRQFVVFAKDHGHVAFLIGGEEQDPPRGPTRRRNC